LAYDSGTDALKQLLLLGKYGARITRCPEKIMGVRGESYYFVEVTSKEGTRYVIEAYGEEAMELEYEASTRKREEKIVITA
jgi:hypothetical protein